MKIHRRPLYVLCMATLVLGMAVSPAMAGHKIGVLAKRGAKMAVTMWGPTAEYLTAQTGEEFEIVPLKFEAVDPAVAAGEVEFVLVNSAMYVDLESRYGVRPLATLANAKGGRALDTFGGVILVRADSDIQELTQLKGRTFMCVSFASFGGGQMAWHHLKQNGIDPQTDFAKLLEGNKHDNVVLAVANGVVDAGTVRSDTLERMQDEGKIDMAQFRVLGAVNDDFPFVHSTQLYPEWPMAATAAVPADLAERVAKALMGLEGGSAPASAAKIAGWSKPADYSSVREAVESTQLGKD